MPRSPVRYTVFKASNPKERRVLVGMTTRPMLEVVEELKRVGAQPALIKSLEFGLTEPRAKAFIDRYLETPLPPGWRFLT